MGWAKDNLSGGDRRAIAEGLMVQGGGKVTQHDAGRGELIGLCPMHQESNPSFSYNYTRDVYNCSSGCGGGDLIKLYAEVNGLANKAGYRDFIKKYGSEDGGKQDRGSRGRKDTPPEPVKVIPEEVCEALPELPELWVEKLIKKRAWTREAITTLGLRLWTAPQGEARKAAKAQGLYLGRKGEQRIAIPVRDSEGRLVNTRLYLPEAEGNKVVSWGRGYGSTRLWPGEGASAVEEAPVLWLCEGEPDVICAISYGLEAVTQTAGAVTWRPEFNSRVAGRHVAIAYDADEAGWKGALKVASAVARKAASVRVIRWPDFMLPANAAEGDYSDRLPEKHGQDLTDFFAHHGQSVDDLMDLLAEAYEIKAPDPAPGAGDAPPEGAGLERFRAWSDLDIKVNFRPMLMVREILAERQICTERESGLSYIYNQVQGVWETAPLEIIKRLVIDGMGIAASRNRVAEMADMIQTLSLLDEGQEMDHDAYMVNVANGMVDLRTWEIKPHAPDWRSTHQHPWEFDPAKPTPCLRWIAGLYKTVQIPEVIYEVQEFAGYCQLRAYPFHKTLWLIGGGNDGKSKFLEILRELVGRKRCAAINLRDLEDQFLRVMMHRAMLNVFTEASADFFRNEHLKALTGGDDVTAAHKHQKPFTFKSNCKHAFSMNALPRMADKSHGLYRRILPIKFRHRFKSEDSDPYIVDKWRAELPGIFQWSLVGLRRLLDRGGFEDSPTTKAVLAEYKDMNDVLRLFVKECCITGEGQWVSRERLFARYESWHEDAKLSKLFDKPHFFRKLYDMDGMKIEPKRLPAPQGQKRPWGVSGIDIAEA